MARPPPVKKPKFRKHPKATIDMRDDFRPLLVTRKQAAKLLGDCDVCLVRRLEKMGLLVAKRLNPRSPVAQVFYSYDNVVTVANSATANAEG